MSSAYLGRESMAPKSPGKIGEIPSHVWLQGIYRVSGKELLGEATSKKHRILRIHMTCYYPKTSDSENTHDMLLWASMGHSIYTCSHVCVCISICTHTHEINAYTEQSSCQKDIRIYSGDFGPRHSLLLSLQWKRSCEMRPAASWWNCWKITAFSTDLHVKNPIVPKGMFTLKIRWYGIHAVG